jgi:hypothetical protein
MMCRRLNGAQSCSLVCRISKRADGILVQECQSSDVEADDSTISPFAQSVILLVGLLGLPANNHSTKTLQNVKGAVKNYISCRSNCAKIPDKGWIVQ